MKVKLSIIKGAFTVLLLSLMISGCGSDRGKGAEADGSFEPRLDTQKEVTINVVGGYDNFPSLERVALDFNAYYPNVIINYSKVDDYENVKDMLLTDNPEVDIFMANNTYAKNSPIVREIAADISDKALGFDISALDESVVESARSQDGGLYRLPLYSVCSGLIVNESLLKEKGLDIPKNRQEFTDCCLKLSQEGYTPIVGYGPEGRVNFSQGLYGSLVMVRAAKQNHENQLSVALNNGEEGAEEVYLEALKDIEAFRSLGFYSKDANSVMEDSYEGTILRFFEGDVPFLACSSETMSGTKKRESKSEYFAEHPFDYTFIASPLGENGAYAYINCGEGLALNKNGAQYDYAAEFLRFFCSVKELNASADVKGMLSTSCSTDTAECFPDLELEDENYVAYISDFYLEAAQSEALNEMIRLVSDDGLSAEEALRRYPELLQENKK